MTQQAAIDEAVGRAVRGAIAATTHSRADVAESIGLSLKSLDRRILGKLPFTVPELMGVARTCDVPFADLLARVERSTRGDAA